MPINLIYGEDSVSANDALAEISRDAGPEDLRDVNTAAFSAPDIAPDQLAAAIFTIPFMSDVRVVVVRGLLSTFERGNRGARSSGGARRGDPLGQWAGLADQLPDMPPSTRLAFLDGPLARNNPMLRKLSPIAEVAEFPLPRDRDMPGWIAARARKLNIDLDPRAAATLADAIGRQPRLIDSELRKLAIYADGRQVGVEDVREMVAYVREANIFQAVDAVIDGRTGVALRLARRIMDDGNPAAYLMTMIARQTRLLLVAKDLRAQNTPREDIGRRLRLSGWVLNKTLQQEARLTHERLARMHALLIETDLALKTRPISEPLAIEILIADLTAR